MQKHTRYAIFAILIGFSALWIGREYLPALAWGGLITITLYPVHKRLCQKISPTASTIALTTACLIFLIAPGALITANAAAEIPDLLNAIKHFSSSGMDISRILHFNSWTQTRLSTYLAEMNMLHVDRPNQLVLPQSIDAYIRPFLQNNRKTLLHTTIEITQISIHLIELSAFTLIAFATFTSAAPKLNEQISTLANRMIGPEADTHLAHLTKAIRGTVGGMLMVALAETFLVLPALLILQCPHAAIMAFILFVTSLIPFCAPITCAVMALVALTSPVPYASAIILAWSLTTAFIGEHYLKPRLVGSTTVLSFLASLIAILGGIKTMGLIGLFLSPAIFSLATALWLEYTKPETAAKTTLQADDPCKDIAAPSCQN